MNAHINVLAKYILKKRSTYKNVHEKVINVNFATVHLSLHNHILITFHPNWFFHLSEKTRPKPQLSNYQD